MSRVWRACANQVQALSGWSTPDVRVYDLRVPNRPLRLLTTAALAGGGSYAVSFWTQTCPARPMP